LPLDQKIDKLSQVASISQNCGGRAAFNLKRIYELWKQVFYRFLCHTSNLGPYYNPNFGVVNNYRVLFVGMKKLAESLKKRAGRLVGFAMWILAIMLLTSTAKNIVNVGRIRREVAEEKSRLEKMKAENARLEAQIALTQGSDFIEKQMRDKLGLAKEGEAIVILPDPEILRKLAPQMPTEEETLPDPNWKKWAHLFTSK
jgi:cell division protein FtsB